MENLEQNNEQENNKTAETGENKASQPATEGGERQRSARAEEYFKNRKQKFFGNKRPREDRGEREGGEREGGREPNGMPYGDGQHGWHTNIKNSIEANKRIQHNRLNTDSKLNHNTKATIRITPLGGLEEIGGNITVIETQNSAILVDVGMSFPDDDMHGVDILIPDFTYLKQIKHKIAGIVITHAHEDHIGAVPYLFREMQFPLYGTPLPLGMI
ncbi:MAG TPA: MBL fold metallo-hydrolase, partial [Campylobacterales bacterium]|nr:MBL fold metallo-hydrolase [Campylobacterales bacterium]